MGKHRRSSGLDVGYTGGASFLFVGCMNVWLNEITGGSVTLEGNCCDKQGVWTNSALDSPLFHIPVYSHRGLRSERGPACLSFLCLVLIRGSLRPPQSLHTHHVPNYNTLSPPCLFNYFSILSKFDFKFASSWGPSHISPPTPTCWFTTLLFAPTLLCVFLYNHVLIYLYWI